MVEETTPEAPKIVFPCENYPVKIVGAAGDIFKQSAMDVVSAHSPTFDNAKSHVNMSKNGKYQAITVFITAESEAQLKAIFEDLKKIDGIQMVL